MGTDRLPFAISPVIDADTIIGLLIVELRNKPSKAANRKPSETVSISNFDMLSYITPASTLAALVYSTFN